MKLDFTGPLLNLSGEALKNPDGKEVVMNVLLANTLVSLSGKNENLAKIFGWGLTLQKTGILDLDKPDQKLLRDLIENSETLFILSKGRLLEVFEKREAELKAVPAEPVTEVAE